MATHHLNSAADLLALRAALNAMRASPDPADRQYVAAHLADQPWKDVARVCAILLQERNLSLRPWMLAPGSISDVEASLKVPVTNHRAEYQAARTLERMLAFGISRYDPDPVRAIADAEQRAALVSVT